MKQPKDLLNIDTLTPWNYSSLQIFKYLINQKDYWSREELDVFLDSLLGVTADSKKQVQKIFKNDAPSHILKSIVDNTKTLLFTK